MDSTKYSRSDQRIPNWDSTSYNPYLTSYYLSNTPYKWSSVFWMSGRRLPGHFNGGNSPIQSPEKILQIQKGEEESAKLNTAEIKKISMYTATSSAASPRTTFLNSIFAKTKGEIDDGKKNILDDLRTQVVELSSIVKAIKKEHGKELEKLRKEWEEEKTIRSNIVVEIEKLKNLVLST